MDTGDGKDHSPHVSLHEHLDAMLHSLQALFDARFKGLEESIRATTKALDGRLEGMNEFRRTLTDQAASFVRVSDYERRNAAMMEDIQMLRESKAMLEGKASQNSVVIAIIIAVIGVVFSAAGLILRMIGK